MFVKSFGVKRRRGLSESGAEATAVQTLRVRRALMNLAKRLDCGAFTAAFSRATAKSLLLECGRPRPQQCSTSNGFRFLRRLTHSRVAAPGDGRTPSEKFPGVCDVALDMFAQGIKRGKLLFVAQSFDEYNLQFLTVDVT